VTIAVIIVAHNSAAHIGVTLRALLEQLDDSDELVVDNASLDVTVKAALTASPRVEYFASARTTDSPAVAT
jgi:GT2 family glycosyltransferase